MLADPERCQVVLVTLPETTPVNELIETAYALEERVGVQLGPVVVNGVDARSTLPNPDPVRRTAPGRPRGRTPRRSSGRRRTLEAAELRRARQAMERDEIERLAGAARPSRRCTCRACPWQASIPTTCRCSRRSW